MGKKLPGASRFWCYAIAAVFTNVRKLRVEDANIDLIILMHEELFYLAEQTSDVNSRDN